MEPPTGAQPPSPPPSQREQELERRLATIEARLAALEEHAPKETAVTPPTTPTGTKQVDDSADTYWALTELSLRNNTADNTGASNPLPILLNPLRSGGTSTRQLHSSDFIRLKEVSLSYRLPESLTKTLRIGSASLSLTANNLAFLYAATKNRELEAALNGFRSADIPALRTISFGLNVGF